ncbi:hypothetical protein L2725_07420 [Shewanella corallii]|uniref:Uncharacterized protein n=1 Tax=Shewanella corallii TaxID=560080 RepID=A0ABT0N578_9GAMM|nr:hypothetical protein [Shewanella corallii]MCL2913618.1 hypothetical protein [Shewanella corallii]
MRTGLLLLSWMLVCQAFAGDIKVHDKTEPFDPFAVRDAKKADHEWQEQQRLKQQLELIESLPLGCVLLVQPYRHYRCGDLYYRPYPQPRTSELQQKLQYQRIPAPKNR